MKNTLIAILVLIILVLGYLFIKEKTSYRSTINEWPETVPATPTNNNSQTNSNNNTDSCSPSIVVSAPATGASYTVGQQVTIKWTTCGVQKVLIGLASGGKNYGHITEASISASTGSYQWTATNPGKGFTGLNTNSYQIVVESESGDVMAKSGTFTVTTPSQSQTFSQPKSSDYPSATPTFSHTTSFTSEPIEMYEQKLGADFLAASPNFASYYRIGQVGCGTACWGFSVVDLRDGKVYPVPQQSGNGYESKVSSKLYAGISTPNFDYPDAQFDAELAAKNREAKVKWYVFNESTKTFTFLKQGYCNLREGQYPSTNTVIECIE